MLTQEDLDDLAAIDGVDAVTGEVTGPVAFQGEGAKPFGDGATGRLWVDDDDLNPLDLREGEAPATRSTRSPSTSAWPTPRTWPSATR